MRIFHHTITIARPREDVFDFFVDFTEAPRWRSYVKSMEPVDGGPVQPGSRIRVKLDLMGEETTYDLNVVAFERPSLWRHRTDEVDFLGYVEYRFDEERGGTRVTLSARAKPVSLYGWLALPLLLLRRGRSYAHQLPQLKRAVEGRSPP